MSTLSASAAHEPPSSSMLSPSLFSSLPRDLVLNILARVPKRYYPIVSCVCKNLRSLVRSPDIHKTRYLLGKDSVYICFIKKYYHPTTSHWYTIRTTENTPANLVASVKFPYPFEPCMHSIITVGPEIVFIGGSCIPLSCLWFFDTRSGQLRRGPSMQVNRVQSTVGLVGGKIYVIEGCRGGEIRAEVFDLKTQSWEEAPIPEEQWNHAWYDTANVSLDNKVCKLFLRDGMACYDARDGSCEIIDLPNTKWWKTGVCVIDNVLYVYFSRFGLMWYDSELMLWRVVYGLDLGKARSVGLAEYYGKLVFLWKVVVSRVTKEIWCRMIVLHKSKELGIHGTAEPSQLLMIVPRRYSLQHFLSLSD